jgi:hypothetical protein
LLASCCSKEHILQAVNCSDDLAEKEDQQYRKPEPSTQAASQHRLLQTNTLTMQE